MVRHPHSFETLISFTYLTKLTSVSRYVLSNSGNRPSMPGVDEQIKEGRGVPMRKTVE